MRPRYSLELSTRPDRAWVKIRLGKKTISRRTPTRIEAQKGQTLHIRVYRCGYLERRFTWTAQKNEEKFLRLHKDIFNKPHCPPETP